MSMSQDPHLKADGTIDLDDDYAVRYWTRKLDVSEEELRQLARQSDGRLAEIQARLEKLRTLRKP